MPFDLNQPLEPQVISLSKGTSINLTDHMQELTHDQLTRVFKAIPMGVTEVDLSGNSLAGKTPAELAYFLSAVPDHVTRINLNNNGFHIKTGNELEMLLTALLKTGKEIIIEEPINKRLIELSRSPVAMERTPLSSTSGDPSLREHSVTQDPMGPSLCGIYFSKNGIVPTHVISNLKSTVAGAKKAGFTVYFWTDGPILDECIRKDLVAGGVVIKDYREVDQPLRDIIRSFVARGHQGDNCAYAIASDILRVAIAALPSLNDFYIYADCNDIHFFDLAYDLERLAVNFAENKWGLSFPINVLKKDHDGSIVQLEVRNDCMIVNKKNNPHFFERFLKEYIDVVLKRAPDYVTPKNGIHAKHQADSISVFCSAVPFKVRSSLQTSIVQMADDSEFALLETVDFFQYFQFMRDARLGNSWRELSEAELDATALKFTSLLKQKQDLSTLEAQPYKNIKVALAAPLDIDVARLIHYFPHCRYHEPKDNTAWIVNDNTIPTRAYVLQFFNKIKEGYTMIASDCPPEELAAILDPLPVKLKQQLSQALVGTALEIPRHAAKNFSSLGLSNNELILEQQSRDFLRTTRETSSLAIKNFSRTRSNKKTVSQQQSRHPFEKYQLNTLYQEDGCFIWRDFPHALNRIYSYGTDQAKYETHIYSPKTRTVQTFPCTIGAIEDLNKLLANQQVSSIKKLEKSNNEMSDTMPILEMIRTDEAPLHLPETELKHKKEIESLTARLLEKLPDWGAVPNDPKLWQGLIRFFFMSLEKDSPKQFHDDPKTLFLEHCNVRCKPECEQFRITEVQWLNLCSGNLKFIEEERGKSLQWRYDLYEVAIYSFGHQEAVVTLYNMFQKISPQQEGYSYIGKQLFLLAAKHGHIHIVATLLKNQKLVSSENFKCGFFNTVLISVIPTGNHKIVEMLLKQNFQYIKDDIDLGESLSLAAGCGHLKSVIALLKYRPILKNYVYDAYLKAFNEHHDEVSLLLLEVLKVRYSDSLYLNEIQKLHQENSSVVPVECNSRMERYGVPVEPISCKTLPFFARIAVDQNIDLSPPLSSASFSSSSSTPIKKPPIDRSSPLSHERDKKQKVDADVVRNRINQRLNDLFGDTVRILTVFSSTHEVIFYSKPEPSYEKLKEYANKLSELGVTALTTPASEDPYGYKTSSKLELNGSLSNIIAALDKENSYSLVS